MKSINQDVFENYILTSNKNLVVFVVNQSPGLKYGLGTYTHSICKVFRDSQDLDFIGLVLCCNIDSIQFKVEDGCPFYFIPKTGENKSDYYKGIVYFIASRLLTERRIIFHLNYSTQLLLAVHAKDILNVRVLYAQHYMDWGIRYGSDYKYAKTQLQRDSFAINKFREEQRMMSVADLILVSAKHSFETLKSMYNVEESKIRLLPLSVTMKNHKIELSLLRRKYNLTSSQRVILYVGRIDNNKGVSALIQAFSKINNLGDVVLWIVGDGDFSCCLKYINEKNWPKITFWGFQPLTTLSEMYAISEFGVLPSFYEEFGLVAVEMMAAELPIIVRDTTGLNNIVEEGKWGDLFSESNNESSLLNVMTRRLLNPHNANFKREMKQHVAEKYCLRNYSEKLFEYYYYLINID